MTGLEAIRREGGDLERVLALAHYNLGNIEFYRKDFDKAIAHYTDGIKTPYPRKGWVTYCLLRRGQSYDQMGRREEALADYKAVLARPLYWDSHKIARAGKRGPPTYDEVLAQLATGASG